jgi:hypothetical protein
VPEELPEKELTAADRAAAMQDLVDLTGELGLYDPVAATGADLTEVTEKMNGCPFCGLPVPCPSHRSGGPA